MLCQHEKSALTEAAATGEFTAALRAQLASCDSCRTTFAEEQALFAAVDSGLRAAANAQIPPSLLPRLRVAGESRTETGPNRSSPWTWLAAASAVATLAIFLMRLPRITISPTVSMPPPAASGQVSPQPAPNAANGATPPAILHPTRHARSNSRPVLLQVQAAVNDAAEPQVFVPPDEREAYLRFVAAVQHHQEIARALAAHQTVTLVNDTITAAPLAIAQLEIKLIDPQLERQADQTDSAVDSGPGEKLR